MWLLNAETRKLEEFVDEHQVHYAILSHCWGKDEVTFRDVQQGDDTIEKKAGYKKIRYTCDQALRDNLKYAWVDTCCIDKSSSAELSEAINSMWRWYAQSDRCYAYLDDVDSDASPRHVHRRVHFRFNQTFPRSRWFERGWTLQELIAPKRVEFFNYIWEALGDRDGSVLITMITQRTRIPRKVLTGTLAPKGYSIAARMSWAAGRKTRRIEDQAYSLLGLFDVNMPLLYGEGHKAFHRLQKEIIRDSADHSFFAWDDKDVSGGRLNQILAPAPLQFMNYRDVRSVTAEESYEFTNRGLRMTLPLIEVPLSASFLFEQFDNYYAFLNCWRGELQLVMRLLSWTKGNNAGSDQPLMCFLYSIGCHKGGDDEVKAAEKRQVIILDRRDRSQLGSRGG